MTVVKLLPPPPRLTPIYLPPSVVTGSNSPTLKTGPAHSPTDDDPVFSQLWSGWFRKLTQTLNGNLSAGLSVTITTAKLTPGGTNGSMTFTNGILTAQTAAT